MMDFLKKLFGRKPGPNLGALIAAGATIIDVRSKGEYQGGHLKKSLNLPLDTLPAGLGKLDKTMPVITCCASGMRSAAARGILQKQGFAEVYNGGGWLGLRKFE
ncbi:rhodanese-like domain-containing protein [Hymenobacter siberiensis]|uniref:rhodanese-like domain-containing protein n=1 Tax=Hymenobacter siberiensis TaxID=2848396 RepID=UPI001C1DF0FB|nr:rhodanese-like domain-containing protein [Hymenobacter siberiensis]MBU6121225.1 rhodanese-like domain-containing protein [Hymenobacter siberiensis]